MPTVLLPLELLIVPDGLSLLKSQLDQVLNNPEDAAKVVITQFLDQAELPIEIPVTIVRDGVKYVIEAAEDLQMDAQQFYLHGLESALKRFRIELNDTVSTIEQLLIEAETELDSIKKVGADELAKIPYEIEIQNNGEAKVFFINQTAEINGTIQGVDIVLKSSSCTFSASDLSQLQLSVEVFLPALKDMADSGAHKTSLDLAYSNGVFTGSAVNIPPARLHGLKATINQLTLIIQNGEFQNGTLINGELVFDFLDDGQNGPGKINFTVELQNNGDVVYEAQSPEGQELKKGSVRIFFEKIEVITHTDLPSDIAINGWAQLPGVVDSATQLPSKTNFDFAYSDPHFEFTGSNFMPIPIGFGEATFDNVFLRIHKSGNVLESNWVGDLKFPFFDYGQLDFSISFVDSLTDRLTIDVSNPNNLPISRGGFSLFINQYQMALENGTTQNISGDAVLIIPKITNQSSIGVDFDFTRNGQDETVNVTANNFGLPEIGGGELVFSTIRFSFLNGAFQSSDIEGRFKLPDTTDGVGLAFDLEILNQGEDYTISLDGSAQDNELNLGPIKLAFDAFELQVEGNNLASITGNGQMQLPGLSQTFAFQFDVNTTGPDPIYTITVQNVAAELSGFNLTFTQILVSSQAAQQFNASAHGTLMLPVFEDEGALNFDVSFDRNNNYQIAVNAGPEFVKFGDFELTNVAIALDVQAGVIQNFTGSANLQIPGFNSVSAVSVNYTQAQNQYLINLTSAVDVNLFGGELHLATFGLEILNNSFEACNATGSFKLPDSTGGLGIQFTIDVADNGKDYTLNLTGTPAQNTLNFGPVELAFSNFSLLVADSDVQNVSGSGSLQFPGLNDSFNFLISVDVSGQIPIYIVEVENVDASLESFQLHFNQIRIESQTPQFDVVIEGNITLPVFSGSPIGFDVAIQHDSTYTIAIDGTGQTATFGAVELRDVVFTIDVDNGQVQNATGAAKLHIPELTESNAPFDVTVNYSTQPNEDFSLTANNLPAVDFSVFTLTITNLNFLIRDGSIDDFGLSGTAIMPFFSNGGGLDFSFSFQDDGSAYSASISSTGTLTASGLELKDIAISAEISNGNLDEITGAASFKFPGSDDFVNVDIAYVDAQNKLTISAQPLPEFAIAGLTFNFLEFGFGLQNGNLVDTKFSGDITVPAFEEPYNILGFEFDLTDGNNYTIEVNPDDEETELKLGDVSIFITNFDMEMVNGDLDSISASAGLGFEGFNDSTDENEPARIDISFDYTKDSQTYSIELAQDQAIDLGGFSLTLKQLQISFTPDALTYPFSFIGEMLIPGLKDENDDPAAVGIKIEVPSAGNFSGSLTSDAVFDIGSAKVSVTGLSMTKNGNTFEVGLTGWVELTQFTGGEEAKMAVEIEISNDGSFKVLGEMEAPNAIKVVDLPNVVKIYLSKLGLERDTNNNWDFTLGGLIENKIVLPGMDELLPSELNIKDLQFGSSFDLDVDIRWPSGLSISFGGEQSEAIIPVNGKFGSVVSLDALKITYQDNGNAGAEIAVAFNGAALTLGPVVAVVDGLGIKATITKPNIINGKPDPGANFGIANLDIAFLPPSGLGVSLETPVFTGGGYLFFDNEKGEYAGALELSFMNMFAISAIGIINSKMPDGKPGTSVLFIMSVEFPPGIALGFGFFISGLGGILGIHRTINTDKLRDGVKAGTIQNILFPKNIIANISRIITDIKEVFPIKRDQFVIGPMAAITWGVPTIVRVDIGLAIEVDNPVKLAILGVLRVILPDESAALIKIQVAFVGIIDFEKGMLSFDASLFDSKVLTFGLEGDMALRLSWGEKKDFVLSVGGFHPSFTPPAYLGLGNMKRLTLKILSGNPRLTLSTYMAITTNTVQFGAGIDFYFGVAGFKIVGEFGFDVLFQFSPFRFIASARARLAVKAGSTTLFEISLSFTLEGPTPWRAKGTAKFTILFFTVKAKFDTTWGDERETTLPDIDVLPLLIEALEDRQNWRSISQTSHIDGMRMRAFSDEDEMILTPNGTIEIIQKIVPLDVEISKFGQYNPADFTKFEIVDANVGSENANFRYIQNEFAPANYLDIGDKDRLALPSFEKQNAGIVLSANSELKTGAVKDREVEYEQSLMDEVYQAPGYSMLSLGVAAPFSQMETKYFSRTGAVGTSKVSAKSKIINPNKVVLKEPTFAVVNTDDLAVVDNAQNLTFMQAQNIIDHADPGIAQNIQLVTNTVLNP